jgi:hypothetical protein
LAREVRVSQLEFDINHLIDYNGQSQARFASALHENYLPFQVSLHATYALYCHYRRTCIDVRLSRQHFRMPIGWPPQAQATTVCRCMHVRGTTRQFRLFLARLLTMAM